MERQALLLTSDAARRLGVSAATVRAWERDGKLAAERTSSGTRLFRHDVVERLALQRAKAPAEAE